MFAAPSYILLFRNLWVSMGTCVRPPLVLHRYDPGGPGFVQLLAGLMWPNVLLATKGRRQIVVLEAKLQQRPSQLQLRQAPSDFNLGQAGPRKFTGHLLSGRDWSDPTLGIWAAFHIIRHPSTSTVRKHTQPFWLNQLYRIIVSPKEPLFLLPCFQVFSGCI